MKMKTSINVSSGPFSDSRNEVTNILCCSDVVIVGFEFRQSNGCSLRGSVRIPERDLIEMLRGLEKARREDDGSAILKERST